MLWNQKLPEAKRMEEKRILSAKHVDDFSLHLRKEEKSPITIAKYLRDVRMFQKFIGKTVVTKQKTIEYKQHLMDKGYAAASVNAMLAAVNSLMQFLEWSDCKVKTVCIHQR